MNRTIPQVDGYIRKNRKWQSELEKLRAILLDFPQLTEEIKWRAPCYTFQGANVIMIGAFKESCVISFVKGALLKDPHRILVKPGENTQAVRVIRFTNVQKIVELEEVLKAYIQEAIEVENAGLKVPLKSKPEPLPQELKAKFAETPALKTAFAALTPGRQRAYILYFSSAKQSETRTSRIEKHVKRILSGKALDDD